MPGTKTATNVKKIDFLKIKRQREGHIKKQLREARPATTVDSKVFRQNLLAKKLEKRNAKKLVKKQERQAAKMNITPKDAASAFKNMLLRYLGENGVDTTQLQQSMDQVDPKVFEQQQGA